MKHFGLDALHLFSHERQGRTSKLQELHHFGSFLLVSSVADALAPFHLGRERIGCIKLCHPRAGQVGVGYMWHTCIPSQSLLLQGWMVLGQTHLHVLLGLEARIFPWVWHCLSLAWPAQARLLWRTKENCSRNVAETGRFWQSPADNGFHRFLRGQAANARIPNVFFEVIYYILV